MTSRERVYRCLEFTGPDRLPRNLWVLPRVEQDSPDEVAAVRREFPGDITGPGTILGPRGYVLARGHRCRGGPYKTGVYVDEWGCIWECKEDGVIGEVKRPPLAEWFALDHYRLPWETLEGADWDAVDRAQRENLAGPKQFMLCGTGVRPFERMQFLRGTENLYVDLAYGTAEVRALCDRVHEFFMKELDGWVRTDCDGISFQDDWGAQDALLVSPDLWRDLFKPLYKAYCEVIHAGGKKAFMHSDGHIAAIYEDLVEVGVDAVNSQLFCMDIEDLGRRFKGRITFWGEIDRQHVLPFGTAREVRAAVGRVRRAFEDPSGGLIAQFEWGANNPVENVRACLEAWDTPLEELPASG
ncbi:MAG: hypothetical protein AMK72_08110 [Planctomycetes bacterium SM23_25]|nr:MAG: hypothetical protein AMK72_08110 [Planctomycetes bacterium SM23_25]